MKVGEAFITWSTPPQQMDCLHRAWRASFRRVASTSYTISRTCPLLIPFRQCQPMCTRNGMRKPEKAFAHQVSPRLSGRSTGSDKQLLTGCMKSGMMTLLQNPLLRTCLSQKDVTERLNASKNASPSRSPCIPHQALAKKKTPTKTCGV